jgi:hypothetical protein
MHCHIVTVRGDRHVPKLPMFAVYTCGSFETGQSDQQVQLTHWHNNIKSNMCTFRCCWLVLLHGTQSDDCLAQLEPSPFTSFFPRISHASFFRSAHSLNAACVHKAAGRSTRCTCAAHQLHCSTSTAEQEQLCCGHCC